MLIDTHCHLWHKDYANDLDEVMETSRDGGVTNFICVGTNLHNSKGSIEISKKYTDVYASVGVYPDEDNLSLEVIDALSSLAVEKKVVAIGECGLDYSKNIQRPSKDQKILFNNQIEIALKNNLPLIIHNREANSDTVEILNEHKHKGLKGVFHCFVGDIPSAREVLDLGFYISFTGIVTFPSAKSLVEVVKFIPLDRILVETDAPYLAPQQFRGDRNIPGYVKIVANRIAEIRGEPLDKVTEDTSKNAKSLFNLK